MLGMHPWIGLADEVRLGLLTEWVTAGLVDEVLAECGVRDQRPGPWFRQAAVPWKTTATQTRASGENRVSTKLGVIHRASLARPPQCTGD